MRKILFFIILALPLFYFSNPSFGSRDEVIEQTFSKMGLDSSKKAVSRGGFYVSGGHNFNYMRYKEYEEGTNRVIDEDYGGLNGFYTAVGCRSNYHIKRINSKPFIETYFQRFSGLITYDGGTSSGTNLDFDDQYARITLFGIKLGAHNEYSEKGDLFFYFDIGKRIWDRGENRTVKGVLCYYEKYWWTYFGIGGGTNYKLSPQLLVGIEGEAMLAPDRFTWMYAELYEGGKFDLGTVFGAEIKIPLKYYFLKNISFDLTPYFTYWEIDKSDTVKISGVEYYEPRSKTYAGGVLTGLTYSF